MQVAPQSTPNSVVCLVQGVYWDTAHGCLRGTWEAGVLQGQGTYDQPSYQFQGLFKQNIPAGECTFTLCAQRTVGLPALAAAHILAQHGPVLAHQGAYAILPGTNMMLFGFISLHVSAVH